MREIQKLWDYRGLLGRVPCFSGLLSPPHLPSQQSPEGQGHWSKAHVCYCSSPLPLTNCWSVRSKRSDDDKRILWTVKHPARGRGWYCCYFHIQSNSSFGYMVDSKWDVAGLRRKSMEPWASRPGSESLLNSNWQAMWPWPALPAGGINPPISCVPGGAQRWQSPEDSQLMVRLSERVSHSREVSSASAVIRVDQVGGFSPFWCRLLCSLGMSRGPRPTMAHQFVAPRWHVRPLGKKPVLTGGSLFTWLDFI